MLDQSPCIYPHRTISSERPWTKAEQFITVEREVTKLLDWEIKIYNQNKTFSLCDVPLTSVFSVVCCACPCYLGLVIVSGLLLKVIYTLFTIRCLIIHDPAYILNIHYLIIHDQVSRVIDQSPCIYPHRTFPLKQIVNPEIPEDKRAYPEFPKNLDCQLVQKH
jgi:hypothetical protein